MNLRSLLLIISLGFSIPASSQFSIGGDIGYLRTLRQVNLNNMGLGVNWQLSYHDRLAFSIRANYYAGSKYRYYTTAEANSSFTTPQEIIVEVENTLSYLHVYLGGRFYYLGGYETDFGAYVLGNLGLLRAPITARLIDFDDVHYSSLIEDGARTRLHNFTFSPGLGLEKKINIGYLYLDAKVNMVKKKYSGEYVNYDIPTTIGVNFGLRCPL